MVRKIFAEGQTSKWIESYHFDRVRKRALLRHIIINSLKERVRIWRDGSTLYSHLRNIQQHVKDHYNTTGQRKMFLLLDALLPYLCLSVFKDFLPLYFFLCSCSIRNSMHMELCLLERQTQENLFTSVFFFRLFFLLCVFS